MHLIPSSNGRKLGQQPAWRIGSFSWWRLSMLQGSPEANFSAQASPWWPVVGARRRYNSHCTGASLPRSNLQCQIKSPVSGYDIDRHLGRFLKTRKRSAKLGSFPFHCQDSDRRAPPFSCALLVVYVKRLDALVVDSQVFLHNQQGCVAEQRLVTAIQSAPRKSSPHSTPLDCSISTPIYITRIRRRPFTTFYFCVLRKTYPKSWCAYDLLGDQAVGVMGSFAQNPTVQKPCLPPVQTRQRATGLMALPS